LRRFFYCRKETEVAAMPKKPKRPCSQAGCPNLTDGRFCASHAKAEAKRYDKYDRDPKHNKRYGSGWRKIRAMFLAWKPLCEICEGEGRLVTATTVHHVKPLADGGTHDFSNLQALCHPCHSRIHAQQGERWG